MNVYFFLNVFQWCLVVSTLSQRSVLSQLLPGHLSKQYPFIVSIAEENKGIYSTYLESFCVGTVISSTSILTTATCCVRRTATHVILGSDNLFQGEDLRVKTCTPHPQFIEGNELLHNVGIVQLEQDISELESSTLVSPSQLSTIFSDENGTSIQGHVLGWEDRRSVKSSTGVLKASGVCTVVSFLSVDKMLREWDVKIPQGLSSDSHFGCHYENTNMDHFDSGSPLTVKGADGTVIFGVPVGVFKRDKREGLALILNTAFEVGHLGDKVPESWISPEFKPVNLLPEILQPLQILPSLQPASITASNAKFPYVVSLAYKAKGRFSSKLIYFCVGTIISPFSVLTSAECLKEHTPTHVVLGASEIRNAQRINVKAVKTDEESIGIVELEMEIKDIVMPKLVPNEESNMIIGKPAKAIGWEDFRSTTSDLLQIFPVNVIGEKSLMGSVQVDSKRSIFARSIVFPRVMPKGCPLISDDSDGPLIFGMFHELVHEARSTFFFLKVGVNAAFLDSFSIGHIWFSILLASETTSELTLSTPTPVEVKPPPDCINCSETPISTSENEPPSSTNPDMSSSQIIPIIPLVTSSPIPVEPPSLIEFFGIEVINSNPVDSPTTSVDNQGGGSASPPLVQSPSPIDGQSPPGPDSTTPSVQGPPSSAPTTDGSAPSPAVPTPGSPSEGSSGPSSGPPGSPPGPPSGSPSGSPSETPSGSSSGSPSGPPSPPGTSPNGSPDGSPNGSPSGVDTPSNIPNPVGGNKPGGGWSSPSSNSGDGSSHGNSPSYSPSFDKSSGYWNGNKADLLSKLLVLAAVIISMVFLMVFFVAQRRKKIDKSKAATSDYQSFDDSYTVKTQTVPSTAIEINEVIGSGALSTVFKATFNGKSAAVKTMFRNPQNKREGVEFQNHISMLKSLSHPNIIRFHGVMVIPEHFAASYSRNGLIFEFMEFGDLRGILDVYYLAVVNNVPSFTRNKTLVDTLRRRLVWQDLKLSIVIDILRGLQYLHNEDNRVVHRNLNSRNILLDNNLKSKITDIDTCNFKSSDDGGEMTNGSSLWTAPEVVLGNEANEKADMYSFGIVLSELCTHQKPYANMEYDNGTIMHTMAIVYKAAHEGLRPDLESPNVQGPPSVIEELFKRCTLQDPSERPTCSEALKLLSSKENPIV